MMTWLPGPAVKHNHSLRGRIIFFWKDPDLRFWNCGGYEISYWINLRKLRIQWSACFYSYPDPICMEILGNDYKTRHEAIEACEEHRKIRFSKLVNKACLEGLTPMEARQLQGFQKLRTREWNKTSYGREERCARSLTRAKDLLVYMKLAELGYPQFLEIVRSIRKG